jgi:hypothetical protein
MDLSDLLSRIAQMLGLKPSEAKRMELMEQKLAASKRTNVDRLEAIKEEIRQLEGRALRKKKELDAARGESKRIIVREIEVTFGDLDRLRSKETILAQNIDRISAALAKIQDVRAAKGRGIEEEQIDEIAIDAEEAFADLKRSDRAADGLDKIQYTPREPARVDVEERMGDLSPTDTEPKKATETGLSAETARRLKDLESLEE